MRLDYELPLSEFSRLAVERQRPIDFDEIRGGLTFRALSVTITGRMRAINPRVQVTEWQREFSAEMIQAGSVIFSCVDSIQLRRQMFRDYREHDWPVFFDGRMSAESLQVYCVERDAEAMARYRHSFFPSHEAHRESCTALGRQSIALLSQRPSSARSSRSGRWAKRPNLASTLICSQWTAFDNGMGVNVLIMTAFSFDWRPSFLSATDLSATDKFSLYVRHHLS